MEIDPKMIQTEARHGRVASVIAHSICTHALTSIHGKVFAEDSLMAGVTSNLEESERETQHSLMRHAQIIVRCLA